MTPDQQARIGDRLNQLTKLALESPAPFEAIATALADCEAALKRYAKRAAVAEPFERVELVRHDGPTLEFTGRLLAETKGRDKTAHLSLTSQIWETEGKALVAVFISKPVNGGYELVRAEVVEPKFLQVPYDPSRDVRDECALAINKARDEQAMREAIMDFFGWSDYARSMARKMGWVLREEVE